jgi:shikimate kinase
MQQSVILVGFTGCGKSAVGVRLAAIAGLAFVDLDAEIELLHRWEKGHPLRCREIFSLYGRECFADFERCAIERLVDRGPMVLATGGGAVVDPSSRGLLRTLGAVVYLRTSPESLFERLSGRGFPAYLSGEPTLANVRSHLQERAGMYEQTAHVVVDTDGRTVGDVAGEIHQSLVRGGTA